jgi:hypothetical protein
MSVDFTSASRRHWSDAALLRENGRLGNADQLYGLSAECALKAVMVASGAQTSPAGDLVDRAHKVHVDALWAEYHVTVQGRTRQRYLTPLGGFAENPFSEWSVEQRYYHDSALPGGAARIRHEKASRACQVVLDRAIADGVVPCLR